ncbi:hypothetical protein LY78DRAFT_655661 [Colletotrichum sublineola]|nr:hypothetical protein LY78DRAFT_655661 [Colletotrichum sublineola]
MSLTNFENSSAGTDFTGLVQTPEIPTQLFTPGQCLFCPKFSPDFLDSVMHMQKSHGLFVPSQQHLIVDVETLFKYLHLIVFGYRECLQCGTQRATVQAVQQHMIGKGHCKFDISDQESEFTEFYDFFEPKDGIIEEVATDKGYKKAPKEPSASLNRKPLLVDEDSLLLPSGRIASKQLPAQLSPSFYRLRRRTRALSSQPRRSSLKNDTIEESTKTELDPDVGDKQPLSKREKRDRAEATYQKTHMRANDRGTLMHLPPSQQRSMIATQQRHEEKIQKIEGRKQKKIDQKGNKNLYAYWATETPVYQCG